MVTPTQLAPDHEACAPFMHKYGLSQTRWALLALLVVCNFLCYLFDCVFCLVAYALALRSSFWSPSVF